MDWNCVKCERKLREFLYIKTQAQSLTFHRRTSKFLSHRITQSKTVGSIKATITLPYNVDFWFG